MIYLGLQFECTVINNEEVDIAGFGVHWLYCLYNQGTEGYMLVLSSLSSYSAQNPNTWGGTKPCIGGFSHFK